MMTEKKLYICYEKEAKNILQELFDLKWDSATITRNTKGLDKGAYYVSFSRKRKPKDSWWKRLLKKLYLPMSCTHLCGKPNKRFHMTCLMCRHRRLAYGQLDPKEHYKVSQLVFAKGLIVPKYHGIYVLYFDNRRRFKCVKEPLLKRILTIAEGLAS